MGKSLSCALQVDCSVEDDLGLSDEDSEEERIVAELELLGVRYLSRRTSERARRVSTTATDTA